MPHKPCSCADDRLARHFRRSAAALPLPTIPVALAATGLLWACAAGTGTSADPTAGDPAAAPAADPAESVADPPAVETPPATEAPPSSPDPEPIGLFTEAQAERGRTIFDGDCADCHTTSEFRGRTFLSNWGRRNVYSFYRTIRSTMPDDNPGGLDEQVYLDVVSYILRMNGHDAGPGELSADSPMRQVRMALPESGG